VTVQAKTASPRGNKKASVAEWVGITDITIHYDRPRGKRPGRKNMGRAGALRLC